MRYRKIKFLFCSILLTAQALIINTNATANDIACPNTIAAFHDNVLLIDVKPVMQTVYEELGCSDTEFIILPTRRSLLSFNSGTVDGEILRVRAIEKAYKAPYVRSQTPIITLSGDLWVRKNSVNQSNDPIAYQLGVVWHENYVSDKNSIPFYTSAKIVEVYNSGKVDKFLGTNYLVTQLIKKNQLTPAPIRLKEVVQLEVFHYLHESYAPFMKLFSDHLIKHDPFRDFFD